MYWLFILIYVAAGALISYHGAWRSIECPILLSLATLICVIIKSKRDEQAKKERTE